MALKVNEPYYRKHDLFRIKVPPPHSKLSNGLGGALTRIHQGTIGMVVTDAPLPAEAGDCRDSPAHFVP